MLRVGICGAGGYTGAELVRLVHAHPRLELARVFAHTQAGLTLGQVLPSALGIPELGDRVLESLEPAGAPALETHLDVVFTALPHGASAAVGAALYRAGLKVVDLSADFRLKDLETYRRVYGEHPAPELLADAVYGLPELHRDALAGARLIAAPGCYVTSALLPLAPLLSAGSIEPNGIIIDAKSGISGAGRKATARTHFPEAAEGMRPYAVAGAHRHIPEIEQELGLLAREEIRVVFTPQLAPMTRGILTIAYARPKQKLDVETVRSAAREFFARGLVSVLPGGQLPDTLWVRGSARAQVAYELDERTGTLLAMCVLDNLAKGASAQAIQALNVSEGWPDSLGLPELAMFP